MGSRATQTGTLSITTDEWASAIAAAAKAYTRPPGSITPQEFAEASGCTVQQASRRLKAMVDAGQAIRHEVHMRDRHDVWRMMAVFTLVKPKR